MQAGSIGPFSALMATSIFMNGITTWLLQVYSSSDAVGASSGLSLPT
jgi:hypothetical protein